MNPHRGGSFDEFLAEKGLSEEVSARAHKRLLALQLVDIMEAEQITETQLMERLATSRFFKRERK